MHSMKKNFVLKTIAYINGFLYFACWLDCGSWLPLIICCITGGYLALFSAANNWWEEDE